MTPMAKAKVTEAEAQALVRHATMMEAGRLAGRLSQSLWFWTAPEGTIGVGIVSHAQTIFEATFPDKAGAAFVSPFVGRLDDIGQDGMGLIADIMAIYRNYPFKTEVLVSGDWEDIEVE